MSEELLVLHDETPVAPRFPVALRGYDKRHVDEYWDWAEQRISDSERHEAEDAERMALLETHLRDLRTQLADAEERASGLPEPSSRIGARLTEMLRLAEQEAEEIVALAHQRAVHNTAQRTADLDARQTEVEGAEVEAAAVRLAAQQDAELLRAQSQAEAEGLTTSSRSEATRTLEAARTEAERLVTGARADAQQTIQLAQQQADDVQDTAHEESERLLKQADEDVAIIHEDGRKLSHRQAAEAKRELEELAVQRDTIAGQLARLQDQLAQMVQPLGGTARPA